MPTANSIFAEPTAFHYTICTDDPNFTIGLGGRVVRRTAASTLNFGDHVFQLPGGRADKSLESSLYPALYLGVVVGGALTNYVCVSSSGLVGSPASAVGQDVLIQIDGYAYAAADVTNQVRIGDPIVAGTTTAGRSLGGSTASYATATPGMAIKAGASALAKSVNVFGGFASGIASTATAANLDTAALSGTVVNATFNLYAFRVATNGSTVTSAMGTAGATLAAVLWPTAGASNLETYGFVTINPTGTGNFVGGTTALDDATVVPNAKYYNLVGHYKRLGVAHTTPASGAGAFFVIGIRE